MALWPRAPLTPRWSSETRGRRAQTESYTRLHRGKSGSLFPCGTLGSRKKPRLVLVLTWGSSRSWSAQVRLIDIPSTRYCRYYGKVVVCIIENVILVTRDSLNVFVKKNSLLIDFVQIYFKMNISLLFTPSSKNESRERNGVGRNTSELMSKLLWKNVRNRKAVLRCETSNILHKNYIMLHWTR